MGTKERYEYGEVPLLSAVAVGVPGKRTFFLVLGEKNNWLRIWLEKEHLEAVVQGIEKLLFTLSQQHISSPPEPAGPSLPDDAPSDLPAAELELAQMTLAYDEDRVTIELLAQPSGAPESEPSEVIFQTTIPQLKKLRRRVKEIYAAGRPLCRLCGGPIDPAGHSCPRLN
jgi:uncharacterized repeat protein (TIGR03847 family)